MVTIIWGVNGFYIVNLFPEGCSYNSDYFIVNILEPLYSMKGEIWSETKKKKLWTIFLLSFRQFKNTQLYSEKLHPPNQCSIHI